MRSYMPGVAAVMVFIGMSAQDAASAAEPCQGILCGVIEGKGSITGGLAGLIAGGGTAPEPGRSAAAPAAAPPESRQPGTGLVNTFTGGPAAPCTGVLCAILPEPTPAPAAAVAQPTPPDADPTAAAAEPSAAAADPSPAADAPMIKERAPETVERRATARCVPSASDPWACDR